MALNITETTLAATSITTTSASTGGTVTALNGHTDTVRGVCWALSPTTPQLGTLVPGPGTGLGDYVVTLTGLPPGTAITYAAYSTDSNGASTFGNTLTLTTLSLTAPVVTTSAVSALNTSYATSGGNVTSAGSTSVTARGICWGTSINPTIAGQHTKDKTGTGIFVSYATGLLPGVLYHIRAYATNSIGTAYGADVVFTANMKNEYIERVHVTKVVPFSINVPFDISLSISQTQISQATVFAPNKTGALAGSKALYRLIGDGATTPTFSSAFKSMSVTTTYDTTINKVNLIEFLFDGIDYWYNIITGTVLS